MGVDWIMAVVQATTKIAYGLAKFVQSDWKLLQEHCAIDLPRWSDADVVCMFLSMCPVQR